MARTSPSCESASCAPDFPRHGHRGIPPAGTRRWWTGSPTIGRAPPAASSRSCRVSVPERCGPPCPPAPPMEAESLDGALDDLTNASYYPAAPIGRTRASSPTSLPTAPSPPSWGTSSAPAGAARPQLAGEPGTHRARGADHRLAAADAGSLQRVERCDPGHGLHRHAGRSDLRPGAHHPVRRRARRAAVERAAAGGLRFQSEPQLGGKGGAPGRLRARERAHRRRSTRVRHERGSAAPGRGGGRGRGRIPCAIAATVGSTAPTAVDPVEALADIARPMARGCTSMPRWRARR